MLRKALRRSLIFMSNFDYHEMNRDGKCRACSSAIKKGNEVLHTYTTAGQGMHIFICESCQEDIWRMMIERYGSVDDLGQKLIMEKLSQ